MRPRWVLATCVAAVVGLAAPFVLRADAAGVPADVTFTKDIAPIIQRSCENCHRPNGFHSTTEVSPWA